MQSNIRPINRKYYEYNDVVYRRETNGDAVDLFRTNKGRVKSAAIENLNNEYYGGLEKQINILSNVEDRLKALMTFSYGILKPIINDGGEIGESAYRILKEIDNFRKDIDNEKQVLRKKNFDY